MSGLGHPVILIVDSDPLALSATAATLQTRHYEVHCAQNASVAHRLVRDFPLDLIVCDIDLRGTDGVELVDALRAVPDRSDVPAMFVSTRQLPDVILRSHKHGSSFHLRKPFDPNILLELVDKALWMPHLVKNHINRPHIPLGAFASPALVSTPANAGS